MWRPSIPILMQFDSRLALLAVVIALSPRVVASQDPILVPQPRELQSAGPVFRVLSTTRIVLVDDLPDDRFAARSLQEELKMVAGSSLPIVPAAGDRADAIVLGRIENSTIRRLLLRHHLETNGLDEQGYVLDVQQDQVLVAGKDAAGLFYGVQTLRQLMVGNNRQVDILGVRVRDWPAMIYRGTQVDLSRGPVPKLDYLKRIVRTIAEFKMNQLNLYIEDAFPMEGQPLVGVLDDTLSHSDFKELVAYAAPYHVEIITIWRPTTPLPRNSWNSSTGKQIRSLLRRSITSGVTRPTSSAPGAAPHAFSKPATARFMPSVSIGPIKLCVATTSER